MDIDLQVRGGRRADWGPWVSERLRFGLRRLGATVRRVRVRLDDVNGPRGGADKRCRLELVTREGHCLRHTAQGADWRQSLAHALDALRLALREWQRRARRPRAVPVPVPAQPALPLPPDAARVDEAPDRRR